MLKNFIKVLFISLLGLSVFGKVYASPFDLTFFGGQSSLKMGDINDYLNAEEIDVEDILGVPVSRKEKIDNAIIAGMDLDINLSSDLSIGPRIAYMSANQGSIYFKRSGSSYVDEVEEKINANLLSLMVGVKKKLVNTPILDLYTGLYFGQGIAGVDAELDIARTYNTTNNTQLIEVDLLTQGTNYVIDLEAGAELSLGGSLSLGASIGYKLAKIVQLKAVEDEPSLAVKEGDVWINAGGDDMEADFGGAFTTFSLNFKF